MAPPELGSNNSDAPSHPQPWAGACCGSSLTTTSTLTTVGTAPSSTQGAEPLGNTSVFCRQDKWQQRALPGHQSREPAHTPWNTQQRPRASPGPGGMFALPPPGPRANPECQPGGQGPPRCSWNLGLRGSGGPAHRLLGKQTDRTMCPRPGEPGAQGHWETRGGRSEHAHS